MVFHEEYMIYRIYQKNEILIISSKKLLKENLHLLSQLSPGIKCIDIVNYDNETVVLDRSFENIEFVQDASNKVEADFSSFNNLKHLHIIFKPRTLPTISQLNNLESITLKNFDINKIDLVPTENMKFLRVVRTQTENLDFLSRFHSLTNLHLESLKHLKDISALKHMPNLEKLSIFDCNNIENIEILKEIPALKYFSFFKLENEKLTEVLKALKDKGIIHRR